MIMRLALIVFVALGLAQQGMARDYTVGQVWEYQTRPGDEGSLLRIQNIETLAGQPVYHISVIGVHFVGVPLSGTLGHLPVSGATLDLSVTKLSTSSATFPDASEGIEQWRAAKGGVFTISVAEIVTFVEKSVRDRAGQ